MHILHDAARGGQDLLLQEQAAQLQGRQPDLPVCRAQRVSPSSTLPPTPGRSVPRSSGEPSAPLWVMRSGWSWPPSRHGQTLLGGQGYSIPWVSDWVGQARSQSQSQQGPILQLAGTAVQESLCRSWAQGGQGRVTHLGHLPTLTRISNLHKALQIELLALPSKQMAHAEEPPRARLEL